jgi:hypothetical protein
MNNICRGGGGGDGIVILAKLTGISIVMLSNLEGMNWEFFPLYIGNFNPGMGWNRKSAE